MKKIIVKEITNEVIDSSIKEENKIKKDEKQKFFDIKFENNLKNKKVFSLTKDKHQVDLSFLGRKGKDLSNAQGVENGNHVKYTNFEKGLDLSYDYQDNLVKESVIINERKDNYDFSFSLNIGELKPVYNSETRTLELNSNGNTVYRILSPFMVDKNNVRSDDCSYEIEQQDSNLMINLHCDSDWINDESRVFPVVVDPTIEVVGDVIHVKQYVDDSIEESRGLKIGLDRYGVYDLEFVVNCSLLKKNINDFSRVVLSLQVMSHLNDMMSSNQEYQLTFGNNKIYAIRHSDIKDVVRFDITDLVLETSTNLNLKFGPVTRDSTIQKINGKVIYRSFKTYFYPFSYSKDESKKSELIIEYDKKKCFNNIKDYNVGKLNSLLIDIRNGDYKIINDLDFKLKSNTIDFDVKAVYDNQNSNNYYMSDYWKTNLHQILEKPSSYQSVLGATRITYVDGLNKKHILMTKWYYVKNNQKNYVQKKDIYLDSDGKLKYNKDGQVYEIKSETTNEEGITYA